MTDLNGPPRYTDPTYGPTRAQNDATRFSAPTTPGAASGATATESNLEVCTRFLKEAAQRVKSSLMGFDGTEGSLIRLLRQRGETLGAFSNTAGGMAEVSMTPPHDSSSHTLVTELKWFTAIHHLLSPAFYPEEEEEEMTEALVAEEQLTPPQLPVGATHITCDDDAQDSMFDAENQVVIVKSEVHPKRRRGENDVREVLNQQHLDTPLHCWRFAFMHALCGVLPEVCCTNVVDTNILYSACLRDMKLWIEGEEEDSEKESEEETELTLLQTEVFSRDVRTLFSTLYPALFTMGVDDPMTVQRLTAILRMDAERWALSWFPVLQQLRHPPSVLWRPTRPAFLSVALGKSPGVRRYRPEVAGPASGHVYLYPEQVHLLRSFRHQLHWLLSCEAKSHQERTSDRKKPPQLRRGVIVPTGWLTRLQAWLESLPGPFTELVDASLLSSLSELGPIPTLHGVRMFAIPSDSTTLSSPASPSTSMASYVVAQGVAAAAGPPVPGEASTVEVLPRAVFDFLSLKFGSGPAFFTDGMFTMAERLMEATIPWEVVVDVEVNVDTTSTGKGAAAGASSQTTSSLPPLKWRTDATSYTTMSDLVRDAGVHFKNALTPRQHHHAGSTTPSPAAQWLQGLVEHSTSTNGYGGSSSSSLVVQVSEIHSTLPFPPYPQQGEEVYPSHIGEEEEEVEVGVPLWLSVEDVLQQIKRYCPKRDHWHKMENRSGKGVVHLVIHVEFTLPAVDELSEGEEDELKEAEDTTWHRGQTGMVRGYPLHSPMAAGSEGACGLTNEGNTCFMNSALQCLSHFDRFTEALLMTRCSEFCFSSVPQALQRLLVLMWSGAQCVVSTQDFKRHVEVRRPRYTGCYQQDAIEFVDELLDCISEELNTQLSVQYRERGDGDRGIASPELSLIYWDDFLKNRRSFISPMFFHQSKSTFECQACFTRNVVFEHDSSLSVPLPETPALHPVSVVAFISDQGLRRKEGSRKDDGWNYTTDTDDEELSESEVRSRKYSIDDWGFMRVEALVNVPGSTTPTEMLVKLVETELSRTFIVRNGGPQECTPDDLNQDEEEQQQTTLPVVSLKLLHMWHHDAFSGKWFFWFERSTTSPPEREVGEEEEEAEQDCGARRISSEPSEGSLPNAVANPDAVDSVTCPVWYFMCSSDHNAAAGEAYYCTPTLVYVENVNLPAVELDSSDGDLHDEEDEGAFHAAFHRFAEHLMKRTSFIGKSVLHAPEESQSPTPSRSTTATSEEEEQSQQAAANYYAPDADISTSYMVPLGVAQPHPEVTRATTETYRRASAIAEEAESLAPNAAEPSHPTAQLRVSALDLAAERGPASTANTAPSSWKWSCSAAYRPPSRMAIAETQVRDVVADGKPTVGLKALVRRWCRSEATRRRGREQLQEGADDDQCEGRRPEPFVVLLGYNMEQSLLRGNLPSHQVYRLLDTYEQSLTEVNLFQCLQLALNTKNVLSDADAWHCPKCQSFVTAHTYRSLFRLPPCLILSLRRFKQMGYTMTKNNSKVAFPHRLDLKGYLDAEANTTQPSFYTLKAVLYHSGTLDYGHYTASAYVTPLKRWQHFNDSFVSPVDNVSEANAYVLCYEREGP